MLIETCHCCLKEKKSLVLVRDLDWGIIPQTQLMVCESCLSEKVSRIAPWAPFPNNHLKMKRFFIMFPGVEVALVSFLKREMKNRVQILEDGSSMRHSSF